MGGKHITFETTITEHQVSGFSVILYLMGKINLKPTQLSILAE